MTFTKILFTLEMTGCVIALSPTQNLRQTQTMNTSALVCSAIIKSSGKKCKLPNQLI